MDFDINRAARIMRAGNEFSETNGKLREAVYSFIEWIFQALDGYDLPGESFGWIFKKNRENNQYFDVSFKIGGWYSVTTNSKEQRMDGIVLFCRALAGPEGEILLAWLEKETKERSHLLVAPQSAIRTFRSSVGGSTSS